MSTNQQEAVRALEAHCKLQNIYLHEGIQSKIVEGAGLGIYSTCKLKPGEKLVQVPAKQIFTVEHIPATFLSQSARKEIPVHAQLAAFFAFATNHDLEPYTIWMATWPALHDFTDSMPIFWGYWAEYILSQLGRSTSSHEEANGPILRHNSKRRRVSIEERERGQTRSLKASQTTIPQPKICLGPALSGTFKVSKDLNITSQLKQMSDKLVSHIRAIDETLPNLYVIEDSQKLVKFLHAWCLVNTRCFYYIPTMTNPSLKKQRGRGKAPSDPNEAMALCPFMDLFNHRAPSPAQEIFGKPAEASHAQLPCKVKCAMTGFQVITDSVIPPDTEILLSYGAHTNDTLWSEYGFLLSGDTNTSDFIHLDNIVIDRLKSTEKAVLEEYGYLGEYTLHNDGSVCYRTELAAWLLVLGSRKWIKVVTEGLDPEEECTSPTGKTKFTYTLKLWLQKVIEAADENISLLTTLEDGQMRVAFRTMHIVLESSPESEEERSCLFARRRDLCLMRWTQLRNMALQGTQTFQIKSS